MANQIIQLTDANSNVLSPKVGHLEKGGIYSIVHPNWNNNVDILTIEDKYNGTLYRVGCTSSSYPDYLPTALQARTMVCFRLQYAGKTTSSDALHAVVVLLEVFPTPGRIWVNTYNTSWVGWKSVTLT